METPKSLEYCENINFLRKDIESFERKIENYKELQQDLLKMERARTHYDLWQKAKLVYKNIQTLIDHTKNNIECRKKSMKWAEKQYALEVLSEKLNEDVAKKIVGFI
jgi:ribosomal protein L17